MSARAPSYRERALTPRVDEHSSRSRSRSGLRRRGAARGPAAARDGLGRPGSVRRRSSSSVRGVRRRRRTRSPRAPARPRCTSRSCALGLGPRRRGDRARRSRGSRPRTSSSTWARRRCSATSTSRRSTSTRRAIEPPSPSARSASSRCTCSGSAPTWTRPRDGARARPLGRRGCRLRVRRLDRRPPRRHVRRRRLLQLPPAQVDHDRRGRHGHHARRRARRARALAARPRRDAHRSRAAHARRRRSCSPSTRTSASTTG